MVALCLGLILAAFLVAFPATVAARAVGRRLSAFDSPGVAGQVKAPRRRVPNTGGVAIFLGIAVPIAIGLLAAFSPWADELAARFPGLAVHLPGIRSQTTAAAALLAGLLGLHIIGLVDDRKPIGPLPKLAIMVGIAAGVAWATQTRMLTLMDGYPGGVALSWAITVLWIVVVTNAFNFMDNMDGLSAGVGAICAAFFMVAALVSPVPQWFVAATLAVLVGSLLGFLVFNFPWRERVDSPERDGGHPGGASIFMGDSGSLVIGFLLAFLSVRVTYLAPTVAENVVGTGAPAPSAGAWYGVFMPLVILAVPLYDFASVVMIRLSQGKSPFVGDLQHFSHRLVRHGLSRRNAVLVIYGCTAVTSISAVSLSRLEPWQAALVGVQTLLVLGVLGLYEWARTP